MRRYTAFDVETPNRYNNRMSAIGITLIEDGKIVDKYYSLVDPGQFFDSFNTGLTGISSELVKNEPSFDELWDTIEPMMDWGVLLAHNAVFDLSVLRSCLKAYNIAWKPKVYYTCTAEASRKLVSCTKDYRLNTMCDFYGIELDHHRADSDGKACAELFLRFAKSGADVNAFLRSYDMIKGRTERERPDEKEVLGIESGMSY